MELRLNSIWKEAKWLFLSHHCLGTARHQFESSILLTDFTTTSNRCIISGQLPIFVSLMTDVVIIFTTVLATCYFSINFTSNSLSYKNVNIKTLNMKIRRICNEFQVALAFECAFNLNIFLIQMIVCSNKCVLQVHRTKEIDVMYYHGKFIMTKA